MSGSWEGLTGKAESYLGEVPVGRVDFAPGRRLSIDTRIIDELRDNASGEAKQKRAAKKGGKK